MNPQGVHQLKVNYPGTNVVSIDVNNIDENKIKEQVVPVLKNNQLVAFPTETVYGLGGNALNSKAVNKIFQAKGRPGDNPLIVHISKYEQIYDLVDPSCFPSEDSLVKKLCNRFWPGPMTILFKKNDKIPDNVTAGQPFVGIRMPSHPIALKIIELCGFPLAAPSANQSGRPSPTCASHVLLDLGRKEILNEEDESSNNLNISFGKGFGVGCIVDGGECNIGVESTVVRIDDFCILRPGGVTLEQLLEFDSRFHYFNVPKKGADISTLDETQKKQLEKPSTPGLKYTHYSPTAKVYLFEYSPSWSEFENRIKTFLRTKLEESVKIGVLRVHTNDLHYEEFLNHPNISFKTIGSTDRPDIVAKNLFSSFREFDECGVSIVILEGISEANEGMAVMNRARKAATEIL